MIGPSQSAAIDGRRDTPSTHGRLDERRAHSRLLAGRVNFCRYGHSEKAMKGGVGAMGDGAAKNGERRSSRSHGMQREAWSSLMDGIDAHTVRPEREAASASLNRNTVQE